MAETYCSNSALASYHKPPTCPPSYRHLKFRVNSHRILLCCDTALIKQKNQADHRRIKTIWVRTKGGTCQECLTVFDVF